MATPAPKSTIKSIVDAYLVLNPVTIDNGVDAADIISVYEAGPEDLKYLFDDLDFDAIITYGEPTVRSQREIQDVPVHFLMRYPVTVTTVDKYSPWVMYVSGTLQCTAVEMQNRMRIMLHAAIAGSAQSATGATPAYVLTIMEERGRNIRIGGLNIWETPYFIEYTTGGP